MKAPITEIFASIQGEGLFVGEQQIFVRFADCNLQCDYCDTKSGKKAGKLTSTQVLDKVKALKKNKVHSVSITGGEPLLYTEFLKELIPQIKSLGLKVYLETNGALPRELAQIVDLLDYVAMDIKLPSACGKTLWQDHNIFLQILRNSSLLPGDYFVKIVLTSKTTLPEIKKAVEIIGRVDLSIPLILQPVTSLGRIKPVATKNIFSFQDYAQRSLQTVKVIPQIHKIIGVR
jgi:organic radical activating enzyme